MGSKKAIFWPVIISIFIHVTLLAVTGMIDLRDNIKPVEIFSVSIKEPEPEEKPAPKKENKIKKIQKQFNPERKKESALTMMTGGKRPLIWAVPMIKYGSYKTKIKNKIYRIWEYPLKASEKNEEGIVVVKISIDADGSLAGATLMSSSGYADLDDGAISVVRAAAPFEPLPEIYNLSA